MSGIVAYHGLSLNSSASRFGLAGQVDDRYLVEHSPAAASGEHWGAGRTDTRLATLIDSREEVFGISYLVGARPGASEALPRVDCTERVAVVLSGGIENAEFVRQELIATGHAVHTEDGASLVAHLVEEELAGDIGCSLSRLALSVSAVVRRLAGSWTLAVTAEGVPGVVLTSHTQPLWISETAGDLLASSDESVFGADNRMVCRVPSGVVVTLGEGREVRRYDADGTPILDATSPREAEAGEADAGPGREHVLRGVLITALLVVIVAICLVKVVSLDNLRSEPVWAVYSLLVTTFILSRFGLAFFYRPRLTAEASTYCPSVAIIVPAFNEPAIAETLEACLSVEYPTDRLRVVVVDDKSTDDTLARIREVAAAHPELTVVASESNGGKRHAMATGIAADGDSEIFVFIDSDSQVRPDAVRKLIAYFADPSVGAVAGHTDVSNQDTNLLTRMQAMQYYIAFRVYKSAEALFSSVTCCSGCFSGYRRAAVDPVLHSWANQRFFGQPSTFGDDRSLTNFLLPDWRVLYAPDAQAYTAVPDRMQQFLRQQLRWKKSWLRESARAAKVMWRKHPVMALMFYLGFLLPFMAPQIVLRAFVVQPHFLGELPYWYLGGVAAMAIIYGLYYRLHQREKYWYKGIFFTMFYTLVLVWQLPYALLTIRDSKWGTR
ncbi:MULTISPECIES: glycosyltransferase [unclassified Rhodococcus (in: high G+C Gram-positive bacteria)]|uniref:glycosyltransferase n=1 Tax=unclassified Rhodococcus (in: high G+C Gram-positive bacteria) TaxID=192944 RepID=UPI0020789F66|nr:MULTISPECIES: glycosyltransferase [unclassified Rhodococcus (in: high G+C Gram-positive bacteria)]